MKRYLKKSLACLLALVMALSAMTCLATAAGSESDEVFIYVTYDEKEMRPGDTVDIDFTISPVENLTRFAFEVTEPEELTYVNLVRQPGSVDNLTELMFNGDGEVSHLSGSTKIQGHCDSGANAFTCDDDFYIFSGRYYVPLNAEAGSVTFGLASGSVTLQGIGTVEVTVVTEPIEIVVVDTAALEAMISSAEGRLRMEGYYSDRSVERLQAALDHANEILENIRDYYQTNVDEALEALTDAYNEMKKPAEELEAAIESAEELRESDYTKESWGNMTDALEAAKQIQDDENATNEGLNAAADALYDAIDALVPVDDSLAASREALEQAVETVKGLNQNDYSESSWAALQTALENAEKVLSDDNATKEELDEAYDALALALARANLEKDVESAKQLDSSNYTADSWEALQTAIANAEEVLDNEDATQAELEDADDALAAALDGLAPASNGGGTTTTYPGGTSSGGTTSGVTSPQTGDSNILLMCIVVLAVGMACCSAVCASKVRGRKK